MMRAAWTMICLLLVGAAWSHAAPYTNHGNGSLTDQSTGLMWQQADDGVTRTWQEALDSCNGLMLAGHSDWRLPNVIELFSIIDVSKISLLIDPVFVNTTTSYYWSSTSRSYPSYAWVVNFSSGYVSGNGKAGAHYIRCVR